MYKALDIAHYIIKKCMESNKAISNLKLQKILYFVQAEFLVTTGQPCFEEEIQAWDFGPVVPKVYYKYRIYGGTSIPYVGGLYIPRIHSRDKKIVDAIVSECFQYSASDLVEITHHQAPWRDAYYSPEYNNEITPKKIKQYFGQEKS